MSLQLGPSAKVFLPSGKVELQGFFAAQQPFASEKMPQGEEKNGWVFSKWRHFVEGWSFKVIDQLRCYKVGPYQLQIGVAGPLETGVIPPTGVITLLIPGRGSTLYLVLYFTGALGVSHIFRPHEACIYENWIQWISDRQVAFQIMINQHNNGDG